MQKSIPFLFLVFLISTASALGQGNGLEEKSWKNGIIEMRDGKQLQGKLNYSFIREIVEYDDGIRIQGFTAIHVAHFVIIDDQTKAQTHFYSFPFDGRKSKLKPFSFYELLHQNGVIALLSRFEYIYNEKNIGVYDPMGMSFPQDQVATEKIKELLYLTTAQAGILEYASIVKDKNAFIKPGYGSKTEYRDPRLVSIENIIERDPEEKYNMSKKVLKEIFTDKYDTVMNFVDQENAKPNTIDNIKIVVDYYAQMFKK